MARRELSSSCRAAVSLTALLTPLAYLIHADKTETESSTITIKLAATSVVMSGYSCLRKY
jgi:hypothetical protein